MLCKPFYEGVSDFEEALVLCVAHGKSEIWPVQHMALRNFKQYGLKDERGTNFARRCLIRVCDDWSDVAYGVFLFARMSCLRLTPLV